ncbi:hypothetical protein LEP1GSC172_3147 [Leptospira noguchii]|uniref:Uncharacterized protein n=1 Tax=Leptospira noguchii TaxID=28182 RepID=M6VSU8_9LEPT|nr:hypothetical protein LEP1GSC172_3147 [Leptospira noguchii]
MESKNFPIYYDHLLFFKRKLYNRAVENFIVQIKKTVLIYRS